MTDAGREELRSIAFKAAAPFLPGGTLCFNAINAALEAVAPMLIAQGMREAAEIMACTYDEWNTGRLAILARAQELEQK